MTRKNRDDIYYELERISHEDLKNYNKRHEQINNYFRENYNYFSEQRRKIFPDLLNSIRKKFSTFEFANFQRAITYKYSLTPLSAQGSILNGVGGRFNIGKLNPNIPKFSALYIAEDVETAIKEKNQIGKDDQSFGLDSSELALLNNKGSFSCIAVSGYLEQTLDLTVKENLKDFFYLIKNIKLSKNLREMANKIKVPVLPEIKTLKELYDTIFDENYRRNGMLFDLPSNSQILGHIAFEAGVQAIKYPSKFTKKTCLAIYPQNFYESEISFVKINSETPNEMKDIEKQIDKNTFKNFV